MGITDTDQTYLEEEYKRLVQSMFDRVRDDYQDRSLTRPEAEKLMEMLKDRLHVEDDGKGELGWQRSSWCVGG